MRDAMHDAIRERAEGAAPKSKTARMVGLIVFTAGSFLGAFAGLVGAIMLETRFASSWPDVASMCCALAGFIIGSIVGASGAVLALGLVMKLLGRQPSQAYAAFAGSRRLR